MTVRHVNTGRCPKCAEIFDRFVHHAGLRAWFEGLQVGTPEAHISCAGRGKADQDAAKKAGTSKAGWGQSAHNYGLAIDIFKLHLSMGAEWPKDWFAAHVAPAIKAQNEAGSQFQLTWYGSPGSSFYELPHVEIKDWKKRKDNKLVE
jgi:hypothetical protein